MRLRMIYWRLCRRPRLAPPGLSGPGLPAVSARPAARAMTVPAASAPADQDHRASVRLLVAAALLRRGDDLGRVAALTSVPVALFELIRGEHGDQGAGEPAARTGGTGGPGALREAQDDRPGRQLKLGLRRQGRARRAIVVLVVTEIVAVASIVASLAALVWHGTALAALAGLAAALVFAVFLATRLLALRGRGRPRRPDAMMSRRRPPDDPSRKPSP